MDWGDKVDWLIEASNFANKPIPNVILNQPELRYDLIEVWCAFWVLHSTRQIGFTLQPITLLEIKTYLELYGDVYDREMFIELLKHLDLVYLNKERK